MNTKANILAHTHGPENLILRALQVMKTVLKIFGVSLQIESGRLDSFLPFAGQFG